MQSAGLGDARNKGVDDGPREVLGDLHPRGAGVAHAAAAARPQQLAPHAQHRPATCTVSERQTNVTALTYAPICLQTDASVSMANSWCSAASQRGVFTTIAHSTGRARSGPAPVHGEAPPGADQQAVGRPQHRGVQGVRPARGAIVLSLAG